MTVKNLLFFVPCLLICFTKLTAQHTINAGWGIPIDIDVSGVHNSEASPTGYRITYTPIHSYATTGVSATVDWSGMDTPCGEDQWFSGMTELGITSRAILGYNMDGTATGTYDVEEIRVHGLTSDGSLSTYLSSDGHIAYTVSFIMWGTCATIEDSVLVSTPTFSHHVAVSPILSMAAVADAIEEGTGRDPFTSNNDAEDWEPSIDISSSYPDPELPSYDEFSDEEESDYSCGAYGRPQYGVNMRILAPGVVDREYYQTTAGPPIDLTRIFEPSYSGIFGKGWRSTVEMQVAASFLAGNSSGDVVLTPERGKKLVFTYNSATGTFTSKNNSDTLYLQGGDLIWHDRQRQLFHSFGNSDSEGTYYIKRIWDRFGNAINFNYLSPGKLSTIQDGSGRSISFSYNGSGFVSSITTPDGRQSSYRYNADGRLSGSVDLEGYTSLYEYDTSGNITLLDFEGSKTLFSYQYGGGRAFLSELTDAEGNKYTYELNMWTTFARNTVTNPGGLKTIYEFDGRGNLLFVERGTEVISYTYDENNRLLSRQLPFNGKIDYEYDDNGRLINIIHNNSGQETFVYYNKGLLSAYTNRSGYLHQYTYNSQDLLTTYRNPAGDVTNYTYNASGRLSSVSKPDGSKLYYTYDVYGNLTKLSDDEGILCTLNYNPRGTILTGITDASGNNIQFTFDNNLRLETITLPDGTTVEYTFGCCAQEAVTNRSGNDIIYHRNSLNALEQVAFPDGKVLNFKYDTDNYLTEITTSEGNKLKVRYNENKMPVSRTNFDGDSVVFGYNGNNQITSVKDERGNIYSFDYSDNRLSSFTDPANNTKYYYRDGENRVWKIVNARLNSTVTYTYNNLGLVTSKNTGNTLYTFRYDKAGRLISEKNAADSTVYKYDTRGNLKKIEWPDNSSLEYIYDGGNRITGIKYPDGMTVNYRYGPGNIITGLFMPTDSVIFEYDNSGRLSAEKRSNSTSTRIKYDQYGYLSSIAHMHDIDTVAGLEYDYDGSANVSGAKVKIPFVPDFGDQTSISAVTYNILNQVISESGNSYSWDTDGNLTGISGNRTFKASYTSENQIDSLVTPGLRIKYRYNGLMQPVYEYRNGTISNFHYDPAGRLMFETDAGGTITRKYIYAGGKLIAMADAAKGLFYYHYDSNGNTIILTGNNGEIANGYWYTPFGEKVHEIVTVENRFTFNGSYNVVDEGNGFYRMGARHYDSRLGRFIQRDPKGMADGTNLYVFALNNPLLYTDPMGTDVANGTADLFTCQGPVYGDDFISEETADIIGKTVDLTTDLAPGISDAKGSAKLLYYISQKDYEKAAMEAFSMAGGKYLGGKLAPEILGKLGEKISKEVAEGMAETTANGVFKVFGEITEEQMNGNTGSPSGTGVKGNAPSYIMGPPVGIQY